MRKFFEKYWFLLKEDSILSNYVTDRPNITYRRARSIKDNLIASHFIDVNSTNTNPPVTKPCGNCESCPFLDTRNQAKLPNGQLRTPRRPVSCHTTGVIYLLSCPCGSYYVGKTRRSIATRIKEHITAATSGYFRTIIGRHFALEHHYQFKGIKFLPLTVIPYSDQGGDWDRTLLQAESRWIYRYHANRPPGLNDFVSYAPFL